MKEYVQKGCLLLVSLFLLLPVVVKADMLPYAFETEPGQLYLAEGDTVKFTLICVNGPEQILKEGSISYETEALEFDSITLSDDDLISTDESKINVDTSIKGQLKYSFEKDFGKAYTYKVIFTFKVKENASPSKSYKISTLDNQYQYLNNSKEFKIIKNKTTEEKNTNNKDLINYVSYGANAVLLITAICLILKKKN